MARTTHKKEHELIDGTPEKRLFLSIISDYDLRTGLCELVDNALDLWTTNKRKKALRIAIDLDVDRQVASVTDNAGGVTEAELRLLIAPGATRSLTDEEVIGIFGVGGKRAAVALGEQVEIKTRRGSGRTFQIDITSDWLSTEDWTLPAYEISSIGAGTTSVEISKMRQAFGREDVERIQLHLGETYGWFISEGCEIRLNGAVVEPKSFDRWAFPKGYEPRHSAFEVTPADSRKLSADLTAGLIRDRDPKADNYGVYVYCNHRLIVKELRTREVGYFVTGEAGVPHPDASLCRVVVRFLGNPELMPWNSSKSGVNFNHPAMSQVRPTLISLVSYFSSLSRRLKHVWDSRVFRYSSGKMREMDASEVLSTRKLTLPKLPRARKAPYIETVKTLNKALLHRMPWTLGLVEALGLVELVVKQRLDTKNRAALILLDSNFEIALKEFMVNRSDLFPPRTYTDRKLSGIFRSRHDVIGEVSNHVSLDPTLLNKARHYYNLRNKLIHERATVGITDAQVEDYREVVQRVLTALFSLRWPRQ